MSFTKYELKEIIMESMYEVFTESSKYTKKAMRNKANSNINNKIVTFMKKEGLWVDSETPAKASIPGWNADLSSGLFNALYSLNYNPSDSTISVTADGKTEKIILVLSKVVLKENENEIIIINDHCYFTRSDGLDRDMKTVTHNFLQKWNKIITSLEEKIPDKKFINKIDKCGKTYHKRLVLDNINEITKELKRYSSSAIMYCYSNMVLKDFVNEISIIVNNLFNETYSDIMRITIENGPKEFFNDREKHLEQKKVLKEIYDIFKDTSNKMIECYKKMNGYNFISVNLSQYRHMVKSGGINVNDIKYVLFHESGHHFDYNKIKNHDKNDQMAFEDFINNNFKSFNMYNGDKISNTKDMKDFLSKSVSEINDDYQGSFMIVKSGKNIPIHDVHIGEMFADRFSGKFARERSSKMGNTKISDENKIRRPSASKTMHFGKTLGKNRQLSDEENPRMQSFLSGYSDKDLEKAKNKELNREHYSERRHNRQQKRLENYLERKNEK